MLVILRKIFWGTPMQTRRSGLGGISWKMGFCTPLLLWVSYLILFVPEDGFHPIRRSNNKITHGFKLNICQWLYAITGVVTFPMTFITNTPIECAIHQDLWFSDTFTLANQSVISSSEFSLASAKTGKASVVSHVW